MLRGEFQALVDWRDDLIKTLSDYSHIYTEDQKVKIVVKLWKICRVIHTRGKDNIMY